MDALDRLERKLVRLSIFYIALIVLLVILALWGCAGRITDPNTGRRVSSSTDRKTDQGPRWEPTYVDGIGWCVCQTDDFGVKHCRPTP
jgi:hypothetical protein